MNEKPFSKCASCNLPMQHPSGRGKATKFCSEDCRSAFAMLKPPKVFGPCQAPDCTGAATRVGKYCEAHYMRLRRKGYLDLETKTRQPRRTHTAGYQLVHDRGHPLSDKGGYVYEHRHVFFHNHGSGPFECHWCSKAVSWATMHVDHVDADKKNNHISNLVASCPKCNQARGQEALRETMKLKHGITCNGETHTIPQWAKKLGISHNSIYRRIQSGWPLELALTTPRGKTGPKSSK